MNIMKVDMSKRNMIIGFLIVAIALVGYYVYTIRSFRANDPLTHYREAMRADHAGGKTPEETLRLFVSALRANDLVQASRYFIFDVSLRRQKWLDRLTQLQKQGLLGVMADDIETHARRARAAYDGDAQFEIMNSNGTIGALIDMEFNAFSGVWKVERF